MRALTKIQTQASMARIGAHVLWERLTDPHPTRLSGVPRSVDSITAPWLTEALCRQTPGAAVVDFDFGRVSIGTTSRRPIHVRYNAAGRSAGLPERVFGKATPNYTSRLVCGLSGAIRSEVNFYNRIRPLLKMETLNSYYAAYDPSSFRSIFLFEDVAATRQVRFLDPHYRFGRADMDSMVLAMAALHSRFWASPMLADFVWIKDALAYQHHINEVIDFRERTEIGLERMAPNLPAGLRARRDALWPALMRSCELRVANPRTLLHADIHPGNWYKTGDGQLGLCDWQCTVIGEWAADFAYAVTSSLSPEDRRAWEGDLLRLYLDALQLPKEMVPSFDQAWLSYRQQTFHGLFNWLFVAGAGAMQPSMQPDDIGRMNVDRMAIAVDDLDSLDAIKKPH
jgi:hypothetical protein